MLAKPTYPSSNRLENTPIPNEKKDGREKEEGERNVGIGGCRNMYIHKYDGNDKKQYRKISGLQASELDPSEQ